MLNDRQIDAVVEEMVKRLSGEESLEMKHMQSQTPARIGVGKCGPRLRTRTLLKLRGDHAAAKDAVRKDVSSEILEELHLQTFQTLCTSKDEFLTRPDLGRDFPEDEIKRMKELCPEGADVLVFVSDGLSSSSVEENIKNLLSVILDGLEEENLKVGVPFFVKYGRVGAMDRISEALAVKVCCVLLGERPGLATAESMSAYIAYEAYCGMPESRRTVVSNIHKNGINPVEAGAYIVELIQKIFQSKCSGVELQKD